jgi:A/G-specific adenine glycosylase
VHTELLTWYARTGRDLPWRRPGFTPWGTLVSEFMLQQTPVARVIPRLDAWLTRWPTPAALAADSPGEAVLAWANLGYPRRALWLHACAVAIVDEHGGQVPSNVDALLALPGVGPYTARAVAVFAFGAHEPVVDTNVRRVLARHQHGLADQGAPSTTRDLADLAAVLPGPGDSPQFNAAIMELGAMVCTARNPQCGECPIASTCAWHLSGHPTTQGNPRAKQKRYEGSDRQARGALLAVLRARHAQGSGARPVTEADLVEAWPDHIQRGRALTTLLEDGLIEQHSDDTFALPS